ncbi:MAG: hypothetical protein AB1568_04510 [Thermodesulfobacteriota bacterium]
MIEPNELLTLLLGCCVAIFLAANLRRLRETVGGELLLAYAALLAGWAFGVAEGFFLGVLLNLLEHVCYAASALFLLSHCIRRDDETA